MTKNKYLICIDAGHGMETKGKETPYIPELKRKIKEFEANIKIAEYTKEALLRCGFNVVMTAKGTRDVPLPARVKFANESKANAFISHHYNAHDCVFSGNDAEGIETWYFRSSEKGKRLARTVHDEVKQGTKQKDRGIKGGDFYVLRATKMPAILIEHGFMDNKKEALRMIDHDYLREQGEQTAKGICNYFNIKFVERGDDMTETEVREIVRDELEKRDPVYHTLADLPFWAKDTITDMVKKEHIAVDNRGRFDLPLSLIRALVIIDRRYL